jgi:hypothetical protein
MKFRGGALVGRTANRELRLCGAIMTPGGHIGPHCHQGDPTIV